ncbi:MAG: PA14 domain-containing protein, partial [Candidatus Promineifilaceae bacterium]
MNDGYRLDDQEPKSGNVPVWVVVLLVITIVVLTGAVIAMASVFTAAREPGPVPTLVASVIAPATASPTMPAPVKTTIAEGPATPTGLPLATGTSVQQSTAVPWVTVTSSPTSLPIPTNTPVAPPASTNTPVVVVPTVTALPTNTALPTVAPNAWYAEYFNNRNLVGSPAVARSEGDINFDWGAGPPSSGVAADAFSARWTRSLAFPAGTYRFNVTSDDGVRVWLDSQLIIDEWHDALNTTYSAVRTVSAGNHTLRVEYEENWGNARIRFWWEDANSYPQWRSEYFANANLSGSPAVVRNDPNINFNWGMGSPVPGLPTDNFSVRWSRSLHLEAGTYTFRISVDDGVRLYLDNRLIINEWRDGSRRDLSATESVSAGSHSLRLEYYEKTGEAVVLLNLIQEAPIEYPDWRGEYWANIGLSGQPAVIRNDRQIDFRWGAGAPYPGLPADQFSVRWSRQIQFLEGGPYRFYAQSDDGIRAYIDGSVLFNEWHDSSANITYFAEIYLTAGAHTIVVEYYENRSNAQIRFWFERTPPTPTASPTSTSTATPTNTPLPTSTPLKITTPVPTNTPSPTPTNTPKPTETPKPT